MQVCDNNGLPARRLDQTSSSASLPEPMERFSACKSWRAARRRISIKPHMNLARVKNISILYANFVFYEALLDHNQTSAEVRSLEGESRSYVPFSEAARVFARSSVF
jgi:hypothetical protein